MKPCGVCARRTFAPRSAVFARIRPLLSHVRAAMGPRPEIFLSAVVPEMNAFRKAVKQALLEIGARPVEHTDFSIEYAALHGVLSNVIGRCEAVIHLAGIHYGMEPADRTLHAPRRSFAQYELD